MLPPLLCSERRRQYFQRANRILGTYAAINLYASAGEEAIEQSAKDHQISDETPMQIRFGRYTIRWPYRVLQSTFASAGAELTNQTFLMVYGNFEAYVVDLVHDAMVQSEVTTPFDEALHLVRGTKWSGKLDRVGQKFGLRLGRTRYRRAYKNIDMGFMGRGMNDPVDFLEAMAEMRHRLVHSAGRLDADLRTQYPEYALPDGALIQLPPELPFEINFFFVPLTDLLDSAFCSRFGWERSRVQIETLVS